MAVMNRRGQAALADALYFLLIVSGLSTFLFFFAVNYGGAIKQQVGLQYRGEYATSALETLLYSSSPRIEGQTLEDATEVDFLLAAMKEDFADNGQFDTTQDLIVNNVVGLMEPLADSFNYLYYIYMPERQEFAFFMLYVSKLSWTAASRGMAEGVTHDASTIYLCKPSSLDKIDPLIMNVGTLYQADSRMQLPKLNETGVSGYNVLPAQVNITMWTATALPGMSGSAAIPAILNASGLNCTCLKELKPKGLASEWGPCS